MNENFVQHWRDVLLRLQEAEEKIVSTQGYTKEVEAIRLMKELIKEQNPNEDFDSPARAAR